jgi:predicted phosphoribosyltransferase
MRPAPDMNGEAFPDRRVAGQRLAESLRDLAGERPVILGIPRGGVVVAAVVADRLGAPLDVVIPRKLGAPGNPELGLGAVAEGVQVLDDRLVRALGVDDAYLKEEIAAQQEEIRRRGEAYRGGRPEVDLAGTTAVVVDDGVATGGTAVAALRWARRRGARKVVLAVPVAPTEAVAMLRREADDVRVLLTPEPFYAVGQWYDAFPQVSDEEVVELLSARATHGSRTDPAA